jgi:hypothetical protein
VVHLGEFVADFPTVMRITQPVILRHELVACVQQMRKDRDRLRDEMS